MNLLSVTLSENVSAQTGFAPLTVTLNPSGYHVTDGPIVKIEYNFDDGTIPQIVKRRLTVTSPQISAYAFPSDPGDPRNIMISHNLFPSVSGDSQIFNISIKVTKATNFTPIEYILPITVVKIDAINALGEGYFQDIHLISTRVSGTKNTKFYTFETVDPRYITFITHTDE